MTDRPDIIDELKAGLEGVTPGPWAWSGLSWYGLHAGTASLLYYTINDDGIWPYNPADAAHIARCSPDNIAALIEWGERMERERDEADRRAGAAERNAEYERDVNVKRNYWLNEAKQELGYDITVSFDIVWSELKSRAEAAEAKVAELTEALKYYAFGMPTCVDRCPPEYARCEWPECHEIKPRWDGGCHARAALVGKEETTTPADTDRAMLTEEDPEDDI